MVSDINHDEPDDPNPDYVAHHYWVVFDTPDGSHDFSHFAACELEPLTS